MTCRALPAAYIYSFIHWHVAHRVAVICRVTEYASLLLSLSSYHGQYWRHLFVVYTCNMHDSFAPLFVISLTLAPLQSVVYETSARFSL